MLIPIKCFTCGEVLADKYRWYQIEVRKMKMSNVMTIEKVVYLTKETTDKTHLYSLITIIIWKTIMLYQIISMSGQYLLSTVVGDPN